MKDTEMLEWTVGQAREAMLRGTTSAEAYAEALIGQMNRCEQLNAVTCHDPVWLLDCARSQDRSGATRNPALPLAGIPLLLKDNIDTADMPTGGGTPALAKRVPADDAPIVKQLYAAGALLAGKANMHELAFGITSNNAFTGAARNPWDVSMVPGGSSGGSAAAVAARMVPASIGTDTGASVRLPAALCGVVGFRPSVGRYEGAGIIPISRTRDTAGPIARCVDDIALLDSVLSGDSTKTPTVSLSDCRLGVPRRDFFQGAETAVAELMEDTLQSLRRAGVTLVEVEIEDLSELNAAVGFPVVLYEFMRDLPRYLRESGYGLTTEDVAEAIASPDVAAIVRSQFGSSAVSKITYQAALDVRVKLQVNYSSYFRRNRLDGVVFPTSVLTARPVGQDETVELNGLQVPTFATYIRNTDPGSNAGIPGISIPIGLTAARLPVGLEIDGPVGSDRRLIAVARAIEQVLPGMPPPSMSLVR